MERGEIRSWECLIPGTRIGNMKRPRTPHEGLGSRTGEVYP